MHIGRDTEKISEKDFEILSLYFFTLLFATKEAILGNTTLVKADMTPKRIVNKYLIYAIHSHRLQIFFDFNILKREMNIISGIYEIYKTINYDYSNR